MWLRHDMDQPELAVLHDWELERAWAIVNKILDRDARLLRIQTG